MLKTTLEQWRLFKAVADCGGFNQAAEVVHKSQSTIHHAVRKLEDLLGVRLFYISGKRVQLSDAGELMLRRANYLLDEANKMEAVAHHLGEGVETLLRLAVDEAFPEDKVHRALAEVSERFPLLSIELQETILSGSNELIESGKVDIAVSPLGLSAGHSDYLGQVSFVAVATPSHVLFSLDRDISFEDLKSHRQIVIRDSAFSANMDSGWLRADHRWTVGHIFNSVALVKRGLGYAWLPEHSVREFVRRGELKYLPLQSGRERSCAMYLNYTDVDQLGPAACCLVAALKSGAEHNEAEEQR